MIKCEETETLGDKCRDLVKGEKWDEALKVCNEALSDRKSLEDGEEYHVLIARARAFLYDNNDDHVVASLKDLDEAIGMKPALTGPYWIRAEANLNLGDFQAARKDLERSDESPRLSDLRRQIDRGEMEMRLAREALQQKNWRGVAERTSSVLRNYSPLSKDAKNLLNQSVLKLKDYPRALKLLKDAKLTGDSVLMAKLLFATGDFPSALKQLEKIKENSDLELFKFIKEVAGKFGEIENLLLRPSIAELEKLSEFLKKEKATWNSEMPEFTKAAELKISSLLCFKYAKVKNSEKAVELCKQVMKEDPKGFIDYSLSLAEAHGHLGQHDEAVGVLEEAARKQPRENRVQEALKAAQKARHEAANPDYYNLLGVPRDASEKQIKLAYRKSAQKYHPDKLKNATPEEKRAAELKMGQINRAYDVLSDKEKRAQFDRGFDPENPQGNPFGGAGGHPGHGGGFHFNFGGPGGGAGAGAGGGVPFEFIFEALRQQQGGGGQRRAGHHGGHQQFHFNFRDDL